MTSKMSPPAPEPTEIRTCISTDCRARFEVPSANARRYCSTACAGFKSRQPSAMSKAIRRVCHRMLVEGKPGSSVNFAKLKAEHERAMKHVKPPRPRRR